MLAVVKMPYNNHAAFKVIGRIDRKTIDYLNNRFGRENIDIDEEIIDIMETDWFDKLSKKVTPGAVVRIYRENFGLTQQELAEKMGMHKGSYISDIEHGRRSISKILAIKLADFFKISIEMIL